MFYQEIQNGYVVRLEKGEQLVGTLQDFITKENIPSCSIQLIGSVTDPVLAYYDLGAKKFNQKKCSGDFELLPCIGSVGFENETPLVHLHASLSDKNFNVIGGHVIEMTVHATCEALLFRLDQKLLKSYNNEIGLKLYDLECKFKS